MASEKLTSPGLGELDGCEAAEGAQLALGDQVAWGSPTLQGWQTSARRNFVLLKRCLELTG